MNTLDVVKLLRPWQWVKNVLLFFPPFLAGTLFREGVAVAGLVPFVTLCLASSCVYVCNDYIDRDHDRLHPRKCNRPVAAGKIGLRVVSAIVVAILTLIILLSTFLTFSKSLYLLAYLLISLLYVVKLRNEPLADIFSIAVLFLLRLEYGGAVFNVAISSWLFLSVLFLALFLSAGKRLNEHIELAAGAVAHRTSLHGYTEGFLAGIMNMTGATVLVTYAMYCVARPALVYSVPLCCFGLFRLLLRTQSGKGGDPTESLFRDGWLFAVGLLWVLMVGWCIYR